MLFCNCRSSGSDSRGRLSLQLNNILAPNKIPTHKAPPQKAFPCGGRGLEQKRRLWRRKRLRQGKKQGVAEVETPDTTMFLTVSTKRWMRSHKQILTFKNTSSVNARCFATKLLRRGALPPSPSGEGLDNASNDIAYHNAQKLPQIL